MPLSVHATTGILREFGEGPIVAETEHGTYRFEITEITETEYGIPILVLKEITKDEHGARVSD